MTDAHPTPAFDAEIGIHHKSKTSNFTMLENDLLRNRALSFKARGILAHLLSHTAGWKIRMSELIANSQDGSYSIRAGVQELMDAGYMTRECVKDDRGRIKGWKYRVFEEPMATTLQFPTSGKPTSGKPDTKNTKGKNTTSEEEAGSFQEPAAQPDGLRGGDDELGLSPEDLAAYNERCERESRPEAPPPTDLRLQSEDDDPGRQFPWRQVEGAMNRIVPELKMRSKGERRDQRMKMFWRNRGKTVGAFELLATKVQASDFLMARNGHKGQNDSGRPYPWSWIFDLGQDGKLRADKIMEDFFSNERMAFVPGKREAAKTTKVMLQTSAEPVMVNLDEMHAGERRYKVYGQRNGLPDVIDLKAT